MTLFVQNLCNVIAGGENIIEKEYRHEIGIEKRR
jgi:hypothetical protein